MVDNAGEELTYAEVLKEMQSGNPQDIRAKLKNSKYDMDSTDENGKTLVCALAEWHQPNTTLLEPFWILLELFADPNIKDKTGNTALHYSCKNKNKALTLLLLLFGANNEIVNDEGKKPFEMVNMVEDAANLNEKVNNYKFYFLQLTRKRRNKLRKIFLAIDSDQGGNIGEVNMMQFNQWLNDEPELEAREDGKKFLEESSVYKTNVVRV